MRKIFLDTSYLKAVTDRGDDLHQKASSLSEGLGRYEGITSEMVLTEFLNAFSGRGEYYRQSAINVVFNLRQTSTTEVVPQSSQQFEQAFIFYQRRIDKGYSLTDCASMLIMRNQKINDVLTYDIHFQQEGFNALLRD